MEQIALIATATFGLETLVKQELNALGFADLRVSEGKVEFDAGLADIPRTNLWLRCADRVLLKMGEFTAVTFDDLFEQTKALPWEDWIARDGRFTVNAKTHKSELKSARSCQSIVKKAVVERLSAAYGIDHFVETGPDFTIQVALHKDMAQLTIDTSGPGLHKRGYRAEAGEAPLKEPLAAALVTLSFWNKERLLIDPMCGSGTILIEAAMMAQNMAPGLNRTFASDEWPIIPAHYWQEARQTAATAVQPIPDLQLQGYDIDPAVIEIARSNAQKAGVADAITFAVKDVKDLWIDQQYGIVVSNPPYGIRLAEYQQINQIYMALNKIFRKKKGWSIYILTADDKFPRYFKRARPDRVRKLYNGTIKVNYYQYYGEKPP
ncbi:MAG: class I SAM-dependent RNA methyltransferase [Ardenticatenaceae bacterium]|nr:class I SAM-dependent RNA methyltransferase [Ardenticatenaceae bacterium]MCB9445686.1 class I SAM-dependent RNA methyltransferase [Ardenticatenaceae bacterium]